MNALLVGLSILTLACAASAEDVAHSHVSKYAGQEQREIKSLSADDIAELRRGGGWGLAKSAELNGMPGPAHLLEMKDEIPLDDTQVQAIEAVFGQMKAAAIEQGARLIALEQELEDRFRDRTITTGTLRASLEAIAEARKELRYLHLAAHLETPGILSSAQIDRYNTLRGYAGADPCANVPQGHDAKMWREHNGCR